MRRRRALDPGRSTLNDGIDIDEEFSGAGDAGDLMGFSGCDQAFIDCDELGVPTETSRQSGVINALAQALTTPIDTPRSDAVATVVVVRSKACERGDLLAGDAADLGHSHQDGDRGWQADAIDAGDQIEPRGEIRMLADRRDQLLTLAPENLVETSDFLDPEAPNTLVTTALAAVLEACNVLGDLLDQRQMLGKRRQARIRRSMDLLNGGRTLSNQGGIDLVVLCPLQMKLGIGPHLRGLEHDDLELVTAKMRYDCLLIAAARLDPDPLDPAAP